MKILNRQFLGVDKTTDVLSFTQLSAKEMKSVKAKTKTSKPQNFRTSEILLGDIVINLQRAKKQAEEHGLTLNEELKKLMIHGLLHLIGYDHEKSRYMRRKMQKKELELLSLTAKSSF